MSFRFLLPLLACGAACAQTASAPRAVVAGIPYKDPQHHAGAYRQISYTRQMKSRTEYVRQECVAELRRQIATHQRFKRLVDQWTDLSIEHSRLTMRIAEPKGT